FRNQEVDSVSELLRDYEIDRELVGTNNIKNHHEYKELQAELEELSEEIEGKEEIYSDLESEIEELSSGKISLQTEVQELLEKRENLAEELSETEVERPKSFKVKGIPQEDYAVIPRQDFEKYVQQNELVPKLVKQNK